MHAASFLIFSADSSFESVLSHMTQSMHLSGEGAFFCASHNPKHEQ